MGNYRELYQLYGDYTEPLKGSLSNNQASMESQAGFFPWLNGAVDVTLFGKKRQPFWTGNTSTNSTPLKTNMSPENQVLEDVFPIEIVPFQGTC